MQHIVILAIFLFIATQNAVVYGKFCGFPFKKLPNWYIPTHYELDISPELSRNYFQGQVDISLTPHVKKPGDLVQRYIIMHAAAHLNINNVQIFQALPKNPNIATSRQLKVQNFCQDDAFKLLVIEIDDVSARTIEEFFSRIIVRINFDGITPMNGQGLIRISANNIHLNIDGLQQHQSQAIYTHFSRKFGARNLFPCFDDPTLRIDAKLTLSQVPNDMRAFSNTPEDTKSHYVDANWDSFEPEAEESSSSLEKTHKTIQFKPIRSISISQLSFAMGPFSHPVQANNPNEGNLSLNLVNLLDFNKSTMFTQVMLSRIFFKLTEFFMVNLPLETITIIGLPSIGIDSQTIKPGFIVVDEDFIYPSESLQFSYENVIELSGHMMKLLARQWIGNMIESEHEYQSWFFEAMADWTLLQLMDKVLRTQKPSEYRIFYANNVISRALQLDSLESATPLCPLVKGQHYSNDDSQISANSQQHTNPFELDRSKSDPSSLISDEKRAYYAEKAAKKSKNISKLGTYDFNDEMKRAKAVAFIESLEYSCWGKFRSVLYKYLLRYKWQAVHLYDFLEHINSNCHFRPHSVMRKFITQAGYPLVKLSYDEQTNMVKVNQEKFKHDYFTSSDTDTDIDIDHENDDPVWIILLSLTYGNSNFGWLRKSTFRIYDTEPNKQIELRDVPKDLKTFRVNGETIDWIKGNNLFKGFHRILYSDKMLYNLMRVAPNQLSDLDCLQLLDDALALFKSGKVGAYYLVETLKGVSTHDDELIHGLMASGYVQLKRLLVDYNISTISKPISQQVNQFGLNLFAQHFLAHGFTIIGQEQTRFVQDIKARGDYYEILAQLNYRPLVDNAISLFKRQMLAQVNLNLHGSIFISIARYGDEHDTLELIKIFNLVKVNSEQLDIKIARSFGLAQSQARLIKFWQTIWEASAKKPYNLASIFIKSLLDSSIGQRFIKTHLLSKLYDISKSMETEQLADLIGQICIRIEDYSVCDMSLNLMRFHEQINLVELNEFIANEKRKRFFLRQLDSDKLVF